MEVSECCKVYIEHITVLMSREFKDLQSPVFGFILKKYISKPLYPQAARMIKVKESRGRRLIGVDPPAPPEPASKKK